jgi:hypothetical protein
MKLIAVISHTWHPLSAEKKMLALISLTRGGRSVGIVRLRSEATEFFYVDWSLCNPLICNVDMYRFGFVEFNSPFLGPDNDFI